MAAAGKGFLSVAEFLPGSAIVAGHDLFDVVPNEVAIPAALGLVCFPNSHHYKTKALSGMIDRARALVPGTAACFPAATYGYRFPATGLSTHPGLLALFALLLEATSGSADNSGCCDPRW